MDRKDGPLRVLVAGPGGQTCLPVDPPVTQDVHDSALAYFEDRAQWMAGRPVRIPADGPVAAHAPAVRPYHWYPNRPVADPGVRGLRNDYPAPVTVGEAVHSSVAHAYWALSVAQLEVRAETVTADTSSAASRPAAGTPRGEGWEHARTAVMTSLLRAEYDQHPEPAEILPATNDATVLHDDVDSSFRGDDAGRSRNWAGRLLERVRSEPHARQFCDPGAVTGSGA
ncbi:NADAR family protein [Streptomyces sp. NPDC058439]|uniref:NADAR family protein n=1 Tax=Streptomyces sp. NPDC058439 TaxID=3346500 RepID=UPI003668EDF3